MRYLRWALRIILSLLGLALLLLGLFLWRPSLFLPLPSVTAVRQSALAPSSLILDRQGRTLYELMDPYTGPHRPLPLEAIPLALRQAVIATEDASFYSNPGVAPLAILRALWTNLQRGEVRSGASTITQQVVRNLLMGASERQEQSWRRKLREALLAYHLTRSLSKDEILALYLNETYFGYLAYGVEAAARGYYGKPVAQLDLAECAMLAGLPQSPVAYNPLTNLPAAKQRQQVVLALMVRAGYITQAEADLAWREPLAFASDPFPIEAPHFCMLVRQELPSLLGEEALRRGGLRVHTTLDLDLQRAAQDHVRRHLAELNEEQPDSPGHNVHNAAVVVLDPQDGALRALVGSPDYFDSRISGAVNAALSLRQPGSAIKPLTYAAAFERGYAPASMIADVPTSFLTTEGAPYAPANYDLRYHGPVLLRQALACSYNVATVRLLERIGVEALVEMAQRLGVSTLSDARRYGLALTLGGNEVQLWQLTAAYAALANGGWRVQPWFIESIEDAQGRVLYHAPAPARVRVLDARVAYLLTDILADNQARVPAFGEGSALELPFAAAAKTGTTTDWRDNWTIGYTVEDVVGVWVGNAGNEPMLRVSGVSGAAPIWKAVLQSAWQLSQQRPPARPQSWQRPAGLREVEVCAQSGLLPSPDCPARRTDLFMEEDVPTETCTWHRLVTLDSADGRLATAATPAERRIRRYVTFWPAELRAWAEEEGLPLPPQELGMAADGAAQPVGGNQSRGESVALEEESDWHWISPAPNSAYRLVAALPLAAQQIEIAVAAPELGLQQVVLWVDNISMYTWSAPPYRMLWPLAPGLHTFRFAGLRADGTWSNSTPRSITVQGDQENERIAP